MFVPFDTCSNLFLHFLFYNKKLFRLLNRLTPTLSLIRPPEAGTFSQRRREIEIGVNSEREQLGIVIGKAFYLN